jgi:Flp pilus assembly CpaF family ATPase
MLEPDDWLNCLRMDEDAYREILQKVTPRIEKSNTVMREAITPHERINVTLRFLAIGRSYADLRFPAAISPQALSLIIPETCKAIYEELKEAYLRVRKRLLIQ